jgi:uncharacterized protein (TIGR03435 family)
MDYQVIGPGWLADARFDIDARADGDLTSDRAKAMLQQLLIDRFRLTARRESRTLPIYALVARADGRAGPQLRSSGTECAAPVPPKGFPPVPPPPPPPAGQQMTPLSTAWPARCPMIFAPGYLSIRQMSMAEFAARLRQFAGRPVVDRTALTGPFDFELQFTPEFLPPGFVVADNAAPSLFTAVQEQLGLRLDAQRGPVDVLVIDRVERPTDN